MNKKIERERVLLFLRDWFGAWKMKGSPTGRLGKTFVGTFQISVPSQRRLEVFGFSPEEALFAAEDDFKALRLIMQHFTHE